MLVALITRAGAADMAGAQTNYQSFCVKCHGPQGKGDGPAGATLDPKPRNFQDCARMKTISNDTLFNVIKNGGAANGLSGAMPAWGEGFDDDDIHDLITYVRTFCKQ
jgi:mono/diheme cytochrome c family protein